MCIIVIPYVNSTIFCACGGSFLYHIISFFPLQDSDNGFGGGRGRGGFGRGRQGDSGFGGNRNNSGGGDGNATRIQVPSGKVGKIIGQLSNGIAQIKIVYRD